MLMLSKARSNLVADKLVLDADPLGGVSQFAALLGICIAVATF